MKTVGRSWIYAFLGLGVGCTSAEHDVGDFEGTGEPGSSQGSAAIEGLTAPPKATPTGVPAPPEPGERCFIASAPSPTYCCPSGWTQLVGDADPNTFATDTWTTTNHCVFSYEGSDTVKLGAGDDMIFAGTSADDVHGGEGNDYIRGEGGADTLRGGAGNDYLYGLGEADVLYGNAGADYIWGGLGNDTIVPGPGVDVAYGEDGDDIFKIQSPCEVSPGDVIDGGSGTDTVQSPLSQTQLTALGVTFTSIEVFQVVAYSHGECVRANAAPSVPTTSPTGKFIGIGPRDDKSALGSAGGTAYSISATGTLASLASGDQVMFDVGSANAFAVRDLAAEQLRIFNATGTLQGTLTSVAPEAYFRVFPGSSYVYAPDVERVGEDSIRVESVEILNLDTSVHSQFATPGLVISRLTPTHLFHATRTDLVKTALDGTQVWSVSRAMKDFAPSETTPTRFIAQVYGQNGSIGHFQENGAVTYTAIDGAPWDMTISPNGQYSAVTVHKTGVGPRLYMFDNGALTTAIAPPLAYANSVWASDRGEVFVGGQTTSSIAALLVYHNDGNLLWEGGSGSENNGMRPFVLTSPDGDRFMSLQTAGMYAFDIDRSPTQ